MILRLKPFPLHHPVCVGILTCFSIVLLRSAGAAEDEHADKAKEPVEVTATAVVSGKLPVLLSCTGEIALRSSATQVLSPRVSGTINAVLKQEGDDVHKGDLIIALDDVVASATRLKAAASVAEARAELDKTTRATSGAETSDLDLARRQTESAFEQATRNAERQRALLKDHLVAAKQVEEAESALKLASEQLQAARRKGELSARGGQQQEYVRLRARVDQAEADLRIADFNVSSTQIAAERDGVLQELQAQTGQSVDANAVLGRVLDTSPENLLCLLSIPVEMASQVRAKQGVLLQPLQREDRTSPSQWRIENKMPVAQAAGSTVQARAVPENPDEAKGFQPGAFVTAAVELESPETTESLLAPATALIPGEAPGEYAIVGIDDGSKPHKHEVKVLGRSGGILGEYDMVAFECDELMPGDLVITEGAYNLPEDATVKPKTASAGNE